jgi:hypothetical protein
MVCYSTTLQELPKEDLENCPLWQATVAIFLAGVDPSVVYKQVATSAEDKHALI